MIAAPASAQVKATRPAKAALKVEAPAPWAAKAPVGYIADSKDGGVISRGCADCPPGGVPEGEPVCFDESVDTFNGGCNSVPNVFSPISVGQTVCGESGNFLVGGGQFRDTDWYEFTLAAPALVTFEVVATFPVRVLFLNNQCPTSLIGPIVDNPAVCTNTVASQNLVAGTYRVFVSTIGFAGTPCGADYVATLSAGQLGACCLPTGCEIRTQSSCTAGGGNFLGGGTNCGAAGGNPQTFSSSPNVPIPDVSCVSDTITVGPSFTLGDVNVSVNLNHTWVSDLEITVTHGADSVIIWDNLCGSNDGINATFDDQGSPVVCGSPTVGVAQPSFPLSAFNGDPSAGAWTLQICDQVGADVGNFNSWSLILDTLGMPPCPLPGACCLPSGCSINTMPGCTALGGMFLGVGTNCGGAGGMPQTFSSSPNLFIPDNTTVTDTITVGPSFTLGDVNVSVNLTHTWVADLEISLSHGSDTVIIWDNLCGSNNDMNVTFDDEAATAVVCGNPTTGTFRPSFPLTAFDGDNSSGAWTLSIADQAGGDTGTLTTWSLVLDTRMEPCDDACAVDLNGDGMVTIADFLEFLNLFAAGDARAEFDGNPGITVGDFLAFLNAFSMGC